MNNEIEWILTDPDNFQYGRRLSTYVFEFKEYDRMNLYIEACKNDFSDEEVWVTNIIDLSTYTAAEIIDYIENYYENLDELFDIYGADSCFMIAECIFNKQTGFINYDTRVY